MHSIHILISFFHLITTNIVYTWNVPLYPFLLHTNYLYINWVPLFSNIITRLYEPQFGILAVASFTIFTRVTCARNEIIMYKEIFLVLQIWCDSLTNFKQIISLYLLCNACRIIRKNHCKVYYYQGTGPS